jgi:hypothetical protein
VKDYNLQTYFDTKTKLYYHVDEENMRYFVTKTADFIEADIKWLKIEPEMFN